MPSPILMLHGAGSARWAFDLLTPHLDDRFAVHAVDRRGRGDAPDGDGPYAIELEVEDVLAHLSELGPGATLFGHSYGALVAAAAAPRAEGLERLALYEPPMGGVLASNEWRERFSARIATGDRDRAVTDFLADIGGYSQNEIDAMRGTPVWDARLEIAPTVIRELEAESRYELPAEALATLDIPVLMLVGSESPGWARRSTAAYAAAMPGAEVVTLEGQGHGATSGAAELVAAELLRFSGPAPARSGG
ncbi:MAG: alpha/beta hydrolase [Thermoleophilaceae bacterium]|nr:alpha/beta hydrolase [Thermoleophilaceae bacterium]